MNKENWHLGNGWLRIPPEVPGQAGQWQLRGPQNLPLGQVRLSESSGTQGKGRPSGLPAWLEGDLARASGHPSLAL